MLEQLRSLIPEQYHSASYIAGGYATNPQLANDIDLWILGMDTPGKILDCVTAVQTLLGVPICDGHPGYENDTFAYIGSSVAEQQEVDGVRSYPVQIFCTSHQGILHLLDVFDVSVHQRAMALTDGSTYSTFSTTDPHMQPRVTNFHTPRRTEERLNKLCQRYGFAPLPADLDELWRLQGFLTGDRNYSMVTPDAF